MIPNQGSYSPGGLNRQRDAYERSQGIKFTLNSSSDSDPWDWARKMKIDELTAGIKSVEESMTPEEAANDSFMNMLDYMRQLLAEKKQQERMQLAEQQSKAIAEERAKERAQRGVFRKLSDWIKGR